MPLLCNDPGLAHMHAVRQARGDFRRFALALCLLLTWLPAGSQAEEAQATEFRVKAAFLYNFARFVTWQQASAGQFTLCILGRDPIDQYTHTLLNKSVQGLSLRVLHPELPAAASECQIVYIGKAYAHRLHEVMPALQGKPVLTVSDIGGFTASGGMIGFLVINNRVRFEINTAAAENAGLTISSKLLTLATSIRSGD